MAKKLRRGAPLKKVSQKSASLTGLGFLFGFSQSEASTGRAAIAQGNALGSVPQNIPSHERAQHGSIPHIAFVVFDAVFLKQALVFPLKRHPPVILRLIPDVILQRRAMGWAD